MYAKTPLHKLSSEELDALEMRLLDARAEVWGYSRAVGGLSLIMLGGESGAFELNHRNTTNPRSDFVFLEEGRFSYEGEKGWIDVDAQLLFAPNGILRKGRFDAPWRLRVIRAPNSSLDGFLPEFPSQIGVFQRLSLLELAVHSFLTALFRNGDDEISAIEAYAIEQLLVEMCGAMLLDRVGGGWNQGTPRAVLRDRAMAVIAQRCADHELDPTRVAQSTHTSLRQLQAVFADVGTTIAAEIRRQRAKVARTLLRDSRYDVFSVDQVADRSGFGTTTSMRRALADIYGIGPREMRSTRTTRRA